MNLIPLNSEKIQKPCCPMQEQAEINTSDNKILDM